MATIEDLLLTEGKAELIGATIARLPPTGRKPNRVAGRICRSLDEHSEQSGLGEAYTGTIGFIVPELPSGRRSFSPDASLYTGPFPEDEMRFIQGPPTFAAEVRSEGDYGDAAEEELAEKRADYFTAGTLVVWDVDPIGECVHVSRHTDPENPVTYRRGQTAEAEPAVPGWRVLVDRIFG